MSYRDSLLLWKVASQYTAHGTLKSIRGKPRTDYVLSKESFQSVVYHYEVSQLLKGLKCFRISLPPLTVLVLVLLDV